LFEKRALEGFKDEDHFAVQFEGLALFLGHHFGSDQLLLAALQEPKRVEWGLEISLWGPRGRTSKASVKLEGGVLDWRTKKIRSPCSLKLFSIFSR